MIYFMRAVFSRQTKKKLRKIRDSTVFIQPLVFYDIGAKFYQACEGEHCDISTQLIGWSSFVQGGGGATVRVNKHGCQIA